VSLPQSPALLRNTAPLVAAIIAAAVTLYAPQLLNDGDTWWHVATGNWIFDHRHIPHTDPFSFTMPGHPWQTHEWLSEVLMAAAYRVGGWSGVMVLFAAATGAAAWIVVARLAKHLGGITLVVVVAVTLSCMGPSLLARPHLLILPLIAIWLTELLQARDENRPPRLAFALLMIPWANLHGSWIFAYLLLGAFGLEALVQPGADRLKVIRQWAPFTLLAIAGAFVTPHPLSGVLFPLHVMTMRGLQSIDEWKSANFSTLQPFEIALLVTILICLWRGVKVPLIRLILLLLLLHQALQHVRQQMILAMVAPFLLAQPIAQALGHLPNRTPRPRWIYALAALVAIGLAASRMTFPLVRGDRANSPLTALSHVPTELRRYPVLNEYAFGGYLIFSGIRPYIDGRADMYGDDHLADFLQSIRPDVPRLQGNLRRYDIRWTILSARNNTNPWLANQPDWTCLWADRYAVVYARTDTLPRGYVVPSGVCESQHRYRHATPTTPSTPNAAQPAASGTSSPPSTTR
jgi:hypothetical protein